MQPLKAAATPSDTASRVHWLTLLLLLATGAMVRFLFLACKPFWFDECFSAEVAQISRGNFLHLLWWREANMSLYYVLLRIWLWIGTWLEPQDGSSQFYIRSLSVVFAVATIPAIYWLARQLYDRRVGLIAATLFTFNAYSVRYAQEARSYALFLLLATLSSGFLIALVRKPVRRNRVGYVLVSVLAVYAHFYALLLLAVHGLALRWLRSVTDETHVPSLAKLSGQMRRVWITIGVAVLPLLIFIAKTGAGPIRWIQRPGLRDVLEFYEHLAGGSDWPLPVICTLACIAALLPVGQRLWNRAQDWESWRNQFLLLWLLFPVGLTVLLSFARPVFLARYMIFCLPALLILVAAGLGRLRQSWRLGIALTGILLLCSQGMFFVYGHDFDDERDASGAATDFILEHALPGDAVIFHIAETRIPYEFFRADFVRSGSPRFGRDEEDAAHPGFTVQLGSQIVFPFHGAGLDYRDFTGKPTAESLRTVASGHPRAWVMLMNNGAPGSPDPTTIMLTGILPESFPHVQRWLFTKVEVRLYSKE
jgi:mannosyltransferase